MQTSSLDPLRDLDAGAVEALVHGRHGNPFTLLGRHDAVGGSVVRAFLPGARSVELLSRDDGRVLAEMTSVHGAGLFVARVPGRPRYLLRIHWPGAVQETEDPYSFGPLLGDMDLYLFAEGRHRELGRCLGAQVTTVDEVPGVRFAVWAPNARRVSVIGDFNSWDGRRHPMRLRYPTGIWELFLPRLAPGERYKYEIVGPDGSVLPAKADPYALATEPPPATASVVRDPADFHWTDDKWMASRVERSRLDKPISVYEVHALSWKRDGSGASLSWDELADKLVDYAAGMEFTHVELLPIMEHPFGGSWGYQPLAQFAPTARLGPPEAFARFVDRCHGAGLGVILDWVPAHFPTDPHGLARFDGTALYEHLDPREGFHQDWNTYIYNLGRPEVSGFLIASALEWLERYHVDGLRVDAVASMLYRDYSRAAGEWVPNAYGGRENLESIVFLRHLNEVVAERVPGAMVIAEESTAWPGVTKPVSEGGLGFTYKWNMGWMHDTLQYMSRDPLYRRHHHNELTFGMVYAYSEHYVLPLSHDEVVHGKGTLLTRMPGDDWQRFANLRAYFGFMWTHPGKKLLFMGGELGQPWEWSHDGEVGWQLLDHPLHRGVQRTVRDLNHLYAEEPALHATDSVPEGFAWVVGDDAGNSVFAFLRRPPEGQGADLLVVCNLTPVPHHGYRIGVPSAGAWREIFNSDGGVYGGSDLGNGGWAHAEASPLHGQPASLPLTLPPLATLVLRKDR